MRTKRDLFLAGCGMAFLVVAALLRPHSVEATPSGRVQAIEFPLPPGDQPWSLTAGPDGNLWYTTGEVIGRLTLDGTVTTFPMPNHGNPDGPAAWPTDLGVHTRPDVPGWCGSSSESARITAGPDGNLWFTMCSRGTIGRITPAGVMTEFPLAASYSAPIDITAGPDGNLWFADEAQRAVGRLTPDGVVTRFPVPVVSGGFPSLRAITAGPDDNLWLTYKIGPSILRITPFGKVTEFSLYPNTAIDSPMGITPGPDGNLWFTAASTIGRITPCGVITGFALPADWYQWPDNIIAGPDGQLWFVNGYVGGAEWISRMSLTGQFARFPTASPNVYPTDITVGPDGHIWYAELDWLGGVSKIARLDLSYVFLPLVGRW
jgi:streptogramin lyase